MMLLDGTGTLPTGTTTSTGGNVSPNTIPANSPSPLRRCRSSIREREARLRGRRSRWRSAPAGSSANNTTIADAPVTVQDTVVMRLTPVPSEGNLPTVPPCQ